MSDGFCLDVAMMECKVLNVGLERIGWHVTFLCMFPDLIKPDMGQKKSKMIWLELHSAFW